MDPFGSKGAPPPEPFGFSSQQPSGAPPPQPIYAQPASGAPPPYGQAAPPAYAQASAYSTQPGMAYAGQTMGPGGQPTMAQPNAYGQPMMGQPMTNTYGQPQPMGMPNQYGQVAYTHNTTIVQVDPNNPAMNERSVRTKCPQCQAEVTTSTEYVTGSCTWMWCLMLGAMGFFCCCFFPFLWDGSKDVIHTCPSCKAEVGRFVRQQRSNVRISPGGHRHRYGHRRGRR